MDNGVPQILTVQIDYYGIWYTTVFAGMAITIVGFLTSKFMRKAFPLSARLLWGYVFLFALLFAECPIVPFGAVSRSFQVTAAQVALELLLIPFAAYFFSAWMPWILTLTAIASCVCVWVPCPGFMIAPSFNTALAALAVPFIPWWASLFVIATALFHHGATAILILGAEFFAELVFNRRLKRMWQILPVGVGLLGVIFLHHTGQWLDGFDRIQHWKTFFEWWAQSWVYKIFGVGPGSFIWISIIMGRFKTPLFLQMHSDWLQILWEEGAVGFLLTIIVYIQAVRAAMRSRVEDLAGVFGLGVFALTYHPARFFPTALLAAWILLRTLSYRKDLSGASPSYYSNRSFLPKAWSRSPRSRDRK